MAEEKRSWRLVVDRIVCRVYNEAGSRGSCRVSAVHVLFLGVLNHHCPPWVGRFQWRLGGDKTCRQSTWWPSAPLPCHSGVGPRISAWCRSMHIVGARRISAGGRWSGTTVGTPDDTGSLVSVRHWWSLGSRQGSREHSGCALCAPDLRRWVVACLP